MIGPGVRALSPECGMGVESTSMGPTSCELTGYNPCPPPHSSILACSCIMC